MSSMRRGADGARKLLLPRQLGCIYPKFAPQPIPEDGAADRRAGADERAYAMAKIAGIKLCQAYARQYGD